MATKKTTITKKKTITKKPAAQKMPAKKTAPKKTTAKQVARTKTAAATKKIADGQKLREDVVRVLRTIFDPELPFNIYDLGLIYGIDCDEKKGTVKIVMTLTSPMCPVADTLPKDVEDKVSGMLKWVKKTETELTWEPPWSPEMMSEDARMFTGL